MGVYPFTGLIDRERAFRALKSYLDDPVRPKGIPIFALHSPPGGGKSKFLQCIGDGVDLPREIQAKLAKYQPLALTWNYNSPADDFSMSSPVLDIAVRLLYS